MEFAQHLVKRHLAAAVEAVADHDYGSFACSRHQRKQHLFYRGMQRIEKIRISLFPKRRERLFHFLGLVGPFLNDLGFFVVGENKKLVAVKDLVGKFHHRGLESFDRGWQRLRIIDEDDDL